MNLRHSFIKDILALNTLDIYGVLRLKTQRLISFRRGRLFLFEEIHIVDNCLTLTGTKT